MKYFEVSFGCLQVLLYLPQHQMSHVFTLADYVLRSGSVRHAKDYKLDAGPEGPVDLTGRAASLPKPSTAGTWVEVDKEAANELLEKAGTLITFKGVRNAESQCTRELVLIHPSLVRAR